MARIIIADDDQSILDLTRHWLEKAGHTVDVALDGQFARKHLEQSGYDLLITDLAMPHVDGIELIVETKKTSPGLKILVISGKDKTGQGLLKAAKRLGADQAIAKPLEELIFIEAVEALLP